VEIPPVAPQAGRDHAPLRLPGHQPYRQGPQHILDSLPRDEMIQAGEEELYRLATGILDIQERQQLRVFVHPDPNGGS